jgi:hypothetical protein
MALSRSSTPLFVAGGLLAGGVIAAAALTATGALAESTPSTPSTPPSQSSEQPGSPGRPPGAQGRQPADDGGHRHRHGLPGPGFGFGGPGRAGLRGDMLHGEIVVKTSGGTETELLQRGTLTANAGSTVTVRSSDGFTVTWTVGSSTSVRSGRDAGTVKDLAVGNEVTAMGTKTSGGGTARFIAERPADRTGTDQAPPTTKAPVGNA